MPSSFMLRGREIAQKVGWLLSGNEVWLILLIMVVIGWQTSPNFLTTLNMKNLLKQSSIIGILSIAQFLVILSAGFDLSVAGILALCSVITARYYGDYGAAQSIGMALMAGTSLGLVNGLVITIGRVPPLITTLAMLGIARGLAFSVTEKSILAWDLRTFGNNTVLDVIPYPALIWFAIALAVYFFLRFTRTGYHIYAVGGREDTARLAGIKVVRIKLLVYTLAGLLSGTAGVLYVARSGSGVPHVGDGWEMDTIASVIIGGSNLFGGAGSLPKAMGGVLIYLMIRNILNLARVDPFYQDILKALIILAAVAISILRTTTKNEEY